MTQPWLSRRVARISATGMAAALLCVQSENRAECVRYHVDVLESPSCGFSQYATPQPAVINNAGVSAGAMLMCFAGPPIAMIWDGGPTALVISPPPGVLETEATGITNVLGTFGQYVICGNSVPNAIGQRPFLYDGKNQMLLPVLPNHTEGFCGHMNDAMEIAGDSLNAISGPVRAVVWRNGQPVELVGNFVGPEQRAEGINNRSQITGWMGQAAHLGTAFIWDRGKVIDLGVIPGCQSSRGVAISERGEVCGTGRIQIGSQLRTHSFYYHDGVLTPIQPSPAYHSVMAYDVENGVVVGTLFPIAGGSQGFMWKNGVIFDVDELIDHPDIRVTSCRGINEDGVIIARCRYQGRLAGLRLTPIPPRFADLNCDGAVGVDDLNILLGAWGACGDTCPADFSDDGVVNAHDLGILLGNWG